MHRATAWALACFLGLLPLHGALAQYETVVVERGDRTPQDVAADVSTVVISDAPLGLDNVAQTLSQVPGLSMTRLGSLGAPIWASLRGSTAEQVGVFLDGVPLNGLAATAVDLTDLPWGDMDTVDVYRGSSPLVYGSNALAGVLAVTTRSVAEDRGRVALGLGSFATQGADADIGVRSGSVGTFATGHVVSSRGDFVFRNDHGTAFDPASDSVSPRLNNDLLRLSSMLGTEVRLPGRRKLTAWAWGLASEQGIAGLATRQATRTRLRSEQLLANVMLRGREELGPGGQWHAQLYYAGTRQRFADPLGEINSARSQTDDRTHAAGGRLYATAMLAQAVRWSNVLHGRYQHAAMSDALAQPPRAAPSSRLQGNVGSEVDFLFAPWRLHTVASVSAELDHDRRAGRDVFGRFQPADAHWLTLPGARLAVWQKPDAAWSWRANAARYGRAPTSTELYGDDRFILSNTALAPEFGWNADVGATAQVAGEGWGVRLDATGFGALAHDLIQYQLNSLGQARAANIGRSRILGVDVALSATLADLFSVTAQATAMDARDISATPLGLRQPLLSSRPRWHLYGRPQVQWRIADARLVGYSDVDWVHGVWLDPANLVALPDRVLWGAGVSLALLRDRLELALRAQNLLDARAFDVAGFPLPSRSFMMTLRLHNGAEAVL